MFQQFTFFRVFGGSSAWLIWKISMLAKCLNLPETWQMCFRVFPCLLFHPWSDRESFVFGQLLTPKIQVAPQILARRAKEGLQAHSLPWLINKHQVKGINHKSTDLPAAKCLISSSMKFYPNQNGFSCQQRFSNVPFRVPHLSLIRRTFPHLILGLTICCCQELHMLISDEFFQLNIPQHITRLPRILLGEVIRMQCFVRKIWASRGPRRRRFSYFPPERKEKIWDWWAILTISR